MMVAWQASSRWVQCQFKSPAVGELPSWGHGHDASGDDELFMKVRTGLFFFFVHRRVGMGGKHDARRIFLFFAEDGESSVRSGSLVEAVAENFARVLMRKASCPWRES